MDDDDAALDSYLALALDREGQQGDEYNSLVREFQSMKVAALCQGADEGEAEYLVSLLETLSGFVSRINAQTHSALLYEIFGFSVWTVPEELRRALLQFMVHLMVAKGELVTSSLRFLAANLQPPPGPPVPETPSTPWHMDATHAQIQDAVIDTIVRVQQLIPTLSPLLLPQLSGGVPNKVRDRASQCLYFRGLFELSRRTHAPAVREGAIALLVDHLISLDVDIRWEHITAVPEEEEADEREDLEDIFELEEQTELLHLGAGASGSGGQVQRAHRDGFEGTNTGGDATASTSGRGVDGLEEAVQKLDSLMEVALEHLGDRCARGQAKAAWNTVLDSFHRTILPTFRAKFTQFLVWFLCSKEPEAFSKAFVDMLFHGLRETGATPSHRSACVAYLASFLARAAFLPEEILVDCLNQLATWCLQYAEREERQAYRVSSVTGLPKQMDPSVQHQVFYAASQSLLYVLCFRMESLVREPANATGGAQSSSRTSVQQLFKSAIPTLLNHRLAPLALCLPSVSSEFARLTLRLGLMDCRPLMAEQAAHARPVRPLEMFFPFDPYLLARSARLLDLSHTYIRWHGGRPRALLGDDEDAENALDSDLSSDDELPGPDDSGDDSSSDSGEEGSSSSESESEDDADGTKQQNGAGPHWIHRPIGMRSSSSRRKRSRPASLQGATPKSGDAFPMGAWLDAPSPTGLSPSGTSPTLPRLVRPWVPASTGLSPSGTSPTLPRLVRPWAPAAAATVPAPVHRATVPVHTR